MPGARRLFEPDVYLNLGVILEIYGIYNFLCYSIAATK